MEYDFSTIQKGESLGYVVYRICNDAATFYIGSTKNLYKRRQRHKSEALLRKGHQTQIHDLVARIGWENLRFEIIQKCDAETAIQLEQKWFERYRDMGAPLCNIKEPIVHSMGRLHTPKAVTVHTDESEDFDLYSSMMDCAKSYGIPHSLVLYYIRNGRKHPKHNVYFKFAE